MRKDYRQIMRDNAVTILFVVLCILSILCSGQSLSYVALELFGRITRNAFLVLALIIPIVAGMGINFAVTIGAMAAQIAALWVTEWQIPGIGGLTLTFGKVTITGIATALILGILANIMLNKKSNK